MEKQKSAALGLTPTDRINHLLARAWRKPIRVKSDYARQCAVIIGMAASLQMITTKVSGETFAHSWHITTKGLTWLSEQEKI